MAEQNKNWSYNIPKKNKKQKLDYVYIGDYVDAVVR